jgi:hypothetical protein
MDQNESFSTLEDNKQYVFSFFKRNRKDFCHVVLKNDAKLLRFIKQIFMFILPIASIENHQLYIVTILSHICKQLEVHVRTMEGVNSTTIYYKTFQKCHNIPQHNNNNNKI